MNIRDFVPLIIMDLLLLVTALINALFSLPILIQVALPIIVFVLAAFIIYREENRKKGLRQVEEKSKREAKFIRKLDQLVNNFVENIINSMKIHSITSISIEIANDNVIKQHNTTWQLFLSHLNDDLTKESILLHDRIKRRKAEFRILFGEFESLLSLLRKFKERFYNMVSDTKTVNQSFISDSRFRERYGKFKEEFDKYMDKLDSFSDEAKVEFGLSLKKGLTEHVKDLGELYKA